MIHVVVVESHHHVLEHIHTVLRKRRLLNKDWTMLHFDSHADLACPGSYIPAIACYRPQLTIPTITASSSNHHRSDDCCGNSTTGDNEKGKIAVTTDITNVNISDDDDDDNYNNTEDDTSIDGRNLYELLDSSSSGIAEWILPLVLAANLRSVRWVRPTNTIPLIPSGDHQFHVGVYTGRSSSGSSRTITLEEKDSTPTTTTTTTTKTRTATTFLDVPLSATVKVDWDCKYYVEDDSYVPTMELSLIQPLQLSVIEGPLPIDTGTAVCSTDTNDTGLPKTTKIVIDDDDDRNKDVYAIDICLDYFSCYNPFLRDIELRSSTYATALHDAILQSKLYNNHGSDTTQSTRTGYSSEVCSYRTNLVNTLRSLQTVQRHDDVAQVASIVTPMIPFYDSPQVAYDIFDRMQNSLIEYDGTMEEHEEIILMSIEAIPYLTMPHTSHAMGDEMDDYSIQERLRYMSNEILQYSSDKSIAIFGSSKPFIITIARSAEDGFTPVHLVDTIQDMVINEIHSIYCGCKNRIKTSPSSLLRDEMDRDPTMHPISDDDGSCRLNLVVDY